MFSSYEEYLNYDFSLDYWSDEGISAACGLLNSFSGEDWETLGKSWRSKTKEWKVRCAETIDSHTTSLVREVLLGMLEDKDPDVVIAAVDSLKHMSRVELNVSPVTMARIVSLRDSSGPVVKAVLDDFIKWVS